MTVIPGSLILTFIRNQSHKKIIVILKIKINKSLKKIRPFKLIN